MAIALDTLAYARRLQEAGFSAQQAEGQASALAGAMTDTLVTKQDLGELGSRIDARLGEQTAIVRGELADLERRMTIRLGTVTVAAVSIVSALVKLL